MNILAEELKKLSDKSLSADEYAEREKQFLRLYYDLREKEDNRLLNKLTLKQRQINL